MTIRRNLPKSISMGWKTMSEAKNISGNPEENLHQGSGGELYVDEDVVTVVDNLIQLHRAYGVLLAHLERKVSGFHVLSETGCETDIKGR
jgi:hypothetical protein